VDELKPLVAYLADPLPTTDLVLTLVGERVPKALADAVKSVGGAVVATDVASSRKDRAAFVDEHVNLSSLRLDEAARRAVGDHLGEQLGRLGPLLEVLTSTYGPRARLGVDDVVPFLGGAGSVPPWDLTDAIDRGDTAVALAMLERMTGAGERHPLQVMAVLHGHYSRMLRLDGAGVADDKAAAAVLGGRTSPFQAGKALKQGRRLGHEGLIRAFGLLAQADADLKGARDLPDSVVMEILVARLSRLVPAARPSARR
jgi:DNA polymerase-3 subunit delta